MRLLNSLLIIIVSIAVVISYATFISFSEHREYSDTSLDYFLLTPTELSKLSKECEESPAFVYSSADGPKPTIVTLNCTIPVDKLEEQMLSAGFSYVNGFYQKEDVQIQVTNDAKDNAVISVAYLGKN